MKESRTQLLPIFLPCFALLGFVDAAGVKTDVEETSWYWVGFSVNILIYCICYGEKKKQTSLQGPFI